MNTFAEYVRDKFAERLQRVMDAICVTGGRKVSPDSEEYASQQANATMEREMLKPHWPEPPA